ncbi:MAG: hypothetical protein IJ583_05355 [Firmicutes bacterium]|nr:hypothetical protein [Bacillota bacterium]
MKKLKRKMCILLAAAVTLSCSNLALAQDEYAESIPQITVADEQITKDDHNDILNVRIPCDISFKITLLEGTDTGWVSSDDFTLENCGSNNVIVKFESVYYKFKDNDDFISVESEEAVKSITDKKAFFMKMICDGAVNREEYIINDIISDSDEDVEFLLKSPDNINGENADVKSIPKNKGVFRFSGAANPLSDIRWKDKDVTVQINFGIYNADTREFIEEKKVIADINENKETSAETQENTFDSFTEASTEAPTEMSTEEITETAEETILQKETEPQKKQIEAVTEHTTIGELPNNPDTASLSRVSGGSNSDKSASSAAIEIDTVETANDSNNLLPTKQTNSQSSGGGSSNDKSTSPSAIDIQTDTVISDTAIQISTEEITEITTEIETTTETTTVSSGNTETETSIDDFISDAAINISDDVLSSSAIEAEKPISSDDSTFDDTNINSNTDILLNDSKKKKSAKKS